MSIIMPDENNMMVEHLQSFYNYLYNFVDGQFAAIHSSQCVEILGKIQGYLLVADKNNSQEYFTKFLNLDYFDLLQSLIEINNRDISYAILKTICFLTTNIENIDFIKELYTSKIINVVISIKYDAEDELTEYLINFMKTLVLKLNKDNIVYFYNYEINDFPLLTTALSFYNSKNPMIRNVVRNIVLQIIKIEEPNLRNFLTAFPFCVYYPHLVFKIREIIYNLAKINIDIEKNIKTLKSIHDDLIDLIFYISDLLSLNIESINFILINCLFNDIIFPTFRSLISKKVETVTVLMCFYIILLILYSVKNELIFNSVSILLFNDLIQKNILKLISESKEFGIYSSEQMKSIDFMIQNTDSADINDENWKKISEFMKNETGMNLGDGTQETINSYNIMKDYIIKINNKNYDDCIKNEIFDNFKIFCYTKDDCFILMINLINYVIIDLYSKNSEEKKKEFLNINSININSKEKIIENELIFNPLKYSQFFLSNLNNAKKEFIFFNILTNLIIIPNSIRLTTNEIILSNLTNYIIYINNNIENAEQILNSNFLPIIIDKTVQKIVEIKRLISQKSIFKILSFEYTKEAFEMYVKNQQKKINDLITLPWLLVPLIYSENFNEYPSYLIPNKDKYEIINELITVYYLFDIINFIKKNDNLLINTKQFPLSLQSQIFFIGKEYDFNELGNEKKNCEYIDEHGGKMQTKPCFIILTNDMFYLGENLNGEFKSPNKIKILKKIPLRRLEIKFNVGNSNILYLFEFENEKLKNLKINCFTQKNAINLMNYLTQSKNTALDLEYLLVITFFEDIISRIK